MTLRIFESFFYKSLIRACSFDNSLAASQNARSYVQTIDHWLMIFVFVERRWKKLTNIDLSRCLENIQIAYLQFVDNIIGVESSAYESINAYYLAVRKHKKTVDFLITFTGANRSIIRRAKYLISKFSEKNEISYIWYIWQSISFYGEYSAILYWYIITSTIIIK